MSENNSVVISSDSLFSCNEKLSYAVEGADYIDGRWAQGGGDGEHVAGYE